MALLLGWFDPSGGILRTHSEGALTSVSRSSEKPGAIDEIEKEGSSRKGAGDSKISLWACPAYRGQRPKPSKWRQPASWLARGPIQPEAAGGSAFPNNWGLATRLCCFTHDPFPEDTMNRMWKAIGTGAALAVSILLPLTVRTDGTDLEVAVSAATCDWCRPKENYLCKEHAEAIPDWCFVTEPTCP